MLSTEETDLLCRVGPGTLMGDLMRQYWMPAVRSDELPAPDCPPLRVRLLGEDLIAFRTSSGAVGLMQNACPHRGASMFFGRNEEEGLRCVYHGWKFDTTGACVDMPSEPAESNFKVKVHARSYPCVERNHVVWTYMGPRETPPPLPDLEPNMLPEGSYSIVNLMRDCNWMQALEGDIDTSHLGFLHTGHLRAEDAGDAFARYALQDRAPRYSVREAEYGVSYGAYREAEPGTYYWRIAHFLFPFYTMTPGGNIGYEKYVRAWVPVDDDHVLFFKITEPRNYGGGKTTPRLQPTPYGVDSGTDMQPQTSDWLGRFRPKPDVTNDYYLDREKQQSWTTYAGLPSHTMEDQAIVESMGPVLNRSVEHLGTSDLMIIKTRRRLLDAAKALRANGTTPPGVDNPQVYGQRSGGIILPQSADWWTETADLRRAFVERDAAELAFVAPKGAV